MNKKESFFEYIGIFILAAAVTFFFFYLLIYLSILVLWIYVPTAITLGFAIAVFLSVFGFIFMYSLTKKRYHLTAMSSGGMIIPCLILVLMLVFPLTRTEADHNQLPNQEQPLISPNGKYILTVPIERYKNPGEFGFGLPFWCVTISVPNGNVIYRDEDKSFPGWFKHYWIWDEEDRAWIYGSDSGTFFYEYKDGKWLKHDWGKNLDISPPESLYPDYVNKKSSALTEIK